MFVVLLESANNSVLSDLDIFTKKYPKSSTLFISKYTTLDDLRKLKYKPLLSMGWLVIYQNNIIKKSFIKFFNDLDPSNLILFRLTNQQKCKELLTSLKADKIPYRFINNYKLDKDKIVNYVHSNLNITKADAKYLCSRSGYYLPEVVKNVQTLKVLDKITKPIIRKYTEENRDIAVYDLVNYLIGLDSKITYEQCMKLLYSYRYGFDHLIKTTLAQITIYVKIYNLILDGELTIVNYKAKKEKITDKDITDMHDFRLFKIIESFDRISYDYLILLQTKLKQISSNFYLGVFDFVTLLKLNTSRETITKISTQNTTMVSKDLKKYEKRLEEFNKNRYSVNQIDFTKD